MSATGGDGSRAPELDRHPQFSIADDQGSQRFEALVEQFMHGSVQLQRAFDKEVENELRVLDSPSATTGRVE